MPNPMTPGDEDARVRAWRKKPVVIEAVQWTGSSASLAEIHELIGTHHSVQSYRWDEYVDLVKREGLKIFTLEGSHMASIGDWIIKGVKGEAYPCKPDIFAATYEPAALSPAAPASGGMPDDWKDEAQRLLGVVNVMTEQYTSLKARFLAGDEPTEAEVLEWASALPDSPLSEKLHTRMVERGLAVGAELRASRAPLPAGTPELLSAIAKRVAELVLPLAGKRTELQAEIENDHYLQALISQRASPPPAEASTRDTERLDWLLRNAMLTMLDDGDGSIGLFLTADENERAFAIVAESTGDDDGTLTADDAPWLTDAQRAQLNGLAPTNNGVVTDRTAILGAIDAARAARPSVEPPQ